MNLKNITSRLIVALFLLAVNILTASAAQDWTYGKHTNNFKFSGGNGSKTSPYLISNAQDLADLAYLVSGKNNDVTGWYFKQTADIVLNDFEYDNDGNLVTTSLKEWTPIGKYGFFRDDDFEGIYDGDGHSVSGIYIGSNNQNNVYIGLFGSCEDAVVKDLTIKNVHIDVTSNVDDISTAMVGSVTGRATSSTFTNVKVENSNIAYSTQYSNTVCGGLAGRVDGNGHFTDCSFKGNIKADIINSTQLGGLIGYVPKGELYMKKCYTSKGKINAEFNSPYQYDFHIGGLVGYYKEIDDGDYVRKRYGLEECTNNMDIVADSHDEDGCKNLYVYAISYKVPSIINCANFGSITIGAGVHDSRMGFTNNFYKAMYCVSYGKYALEEGTTLDRNVYIDILGKYSDNDEATFDEATIKEFINGGAVAGGSGVFACPKECLPDNVSAEWKKKYCSARNTQVSVDFLKAHAAALAARVNKLCGKQVWGTANSRGTAPFDITGCPTTAAAEKFDSFVGEGTAEDPCLITSEADLRLLQSKIETDGAEWASKTYKLTTDIDLAGKASMGAIGTDKTPFAGTFDGDGHVISNLTESGPALFGYLDGTVKNLGVVNVTFVGGQSNCAGMAYTAGTNSAATITNCYVGGTVGMENPTNAKKYTLAGMVSTIHGGAATTIKNCYLKGTLSITGTVDQAATLNYFGFVSDDDLSNTKLLTCSDCYASFSIVSPSKDISSVSTGFMSSTSRATVSDCFYVCNGNTSLGTSLDSDADLYQKFSGKDGWLCGSKQSARLARPVLKAVRHYRAYGVDGLPYYVDAIPVSSNDNDISTIDLSDEENSGCANDPLLWALPNMAVYNPDDQTEYILNCNLLPGVNYRYNKDSNSKMVKGEMHYPLTVSQNGYSLLCLPGVVRKEGLPEGTKLYISGKVYKENGQNLSDVVDCDTVPAGVPFIVKVPTKTTDDDGNTVSLVGKTFDVVMRGEIVTAPQTKLPLGKTTDLTGTFKNYDPAYPCVDINDDDGTLKVCYNKRVKSIPPFSAYFSDDKVVYLVDYILLDETANDIQDIITSNKGKTVNIKLKRALKNGEWNTICLPFAMSDEEIQNAFGKGTLVEQPTEGGTIDGISTLTFSKTTEGIEAGKAYFIKPASESPVTVLNFRDKRMGDRDVEEPAEGYYMSGSDARLYFNGSFKRRLLGSVALVAEYGGYYYIHDNSISSVVIGNPVPLDGFRCYIYTTEVKTKSPVRIIHSDGSTTTGLRLVPVGSTADGQRAYNLQGMQVDEKAGRGVYIKNGRKFVRK